MSDIGYTESEYGPPSDDHCYICWSDERRGLMVLDRSVGGMFVHQECLDWWGVETCAQWERMYIDNWD
jgi:hypothetical protein